MKKSATAARNPGTSSSKPSTPVAKPPKKRKQDLLYYNTLLAEAKLDNQLQQNSNLELDARIAACRDGAPQPLARLEKAA